MPRLILMRHAKAAWPEDCQDHDRPLAERGREDAPRLGAWLSAQDLVPDEVLCSDALRTRETAQGALSQCPGAAAPKLMPQLYDAPAGTLLAALQQAEGDCTLLCAHNPGTGQLARLLAQVPPDHPRFLDYPTAATTVLEFAGAWRDLAPGRARVLAFAVPADL